MSRANVRPLLLPEILSHIARHVPLFEPSVNDDDSIDYVFTPCHLHACILVSRLWHQSFLPHLYHYFVDIEMCSARMACSDFLKHRHLFRRFLIYTNGPNPDRITTDDHGNLPITLVGLHVLFGASVQSHLLLRYGGPKLRELTWCAEVYSSPMQWPIVDAIMKLTGLQELTLAHWNLRSEDMYMIFLGCSATLQRLTLRTISGYDEEVFVGFKRHIWITSPAEPIMSPSPETPPPLLGLHQPLPLQLTALRELQLTLDWPQSRAVVHLPRICPALEILVLEVDIEEFDLPVMITNLRQYCPRLHSIQYIEGYSMRHETGYYPDPDIYASLFRDSARHLKTAIIPLHDRLDRQKRIVGALETHVNTLETIKLSLTWSHSLNIALITSIVIKAPKLKRLVLRVGCEVQDMDPLLSKPWMCLNLESLVISEYSSENISDNMVSPLPPTFAALALNNQQHLLYKDEGQGWFLKQGKNAKYYAVAVRDYEFKVRLFRHMRTSGLVHVRRVTMDGTQFYAEEQPLSDFEENDDDDE